MKFQHPEFLYFLLLLIIPIILHLFNFRKYKKIYFSSILFLKSIQEETRSVQKLKHILILTARALAFTSLIFAFAQPYIPSKKKSNDPNSVFAIYIDNSFSMSLPGTEGQLISEAKEQAKRLILQLKPQQKILLLSNELSGIEQQITNKSEALARLERITLHPSTRSIPSIIEWIKDGFEINTVSKQGNTIVLLSDFQKNTSELNKLIPDKKTNYIPIQLHSQIQQNVSIDSVWFTDPNFKTKVNNELCILLSNYSTKKIDHIEVSININETRRTIFSEIPPQGKKTIVLNYSDYTAGEKKGIIKINDKNIYQDDEFNFTYDVLPNSTVLIVNGENASKKISAVFKLDNYFTLSEIPAEKFLPEAIENKQLIILNGLNKLESSLLKSIRTFNQTGGSCIIFPGINIDKNNWNNAMEALNLPSFGSIIREGNDLKTISYSHPFFESVFDAKPKNTFPSDIKKSYDIQTNNYATPLITLQNGNPLLLKSASNYLFSSSLDSNFSNFTSNSLFPTIALRIGGLSQQRSPLFLTIGKSNSFPIYNHTKTEKPFKLSTRLKEFIPLVTQKNNTTFISLINNNQSINLAQGIYTLSNENYSKNVALNYDRTESNINPITPNELSNSFNTNLFPNTTLYKLNKGVINITTNELGTIEYWRFLLILAFVFLITEMALIRFLP